MFSLQGKTVDQMDLVIVVDGVEVFYCDTLREAKAWLLASLDKDAHAEVYRQGSAGICVGSGYIRDIR